MKHLFTYGSLMFEPVWNRLVQGHYLSSRACLNGYARRAIKEDVYPVIFEAPESVEGVVYYDVNTTDLIILDTFEGEYYERKEVELLVDSSVLKAQTYVLKPKYHTLIDTALWNEHQFETTGMYHFLDAYKGFSND